jgi:TonB-linked outer membrane protein, SusC/RagA family
MKKVLLLCILSICAFSTWAQDRVVSGRVTSTEDGSTLPGVNVVVKGTTNGTVTDVDGKYSISVPSAGGSLVFSFIGLKTQEIPIGERSVIDISLGLDVTQLSEIVVTGYGIQQEKRSLTGAVSSVKGDAFENLPIQSADRAIQGRIAGVQIGAATGQPGGALNVRVRGIGSLNANNEPLWIVDGVQMSKLGGTGQGSQNPLTAINPNDIESVDVLKDAASAAIYGAQAANGVIIITTKNGKKGAPKIDFTVQEGVVQPMNLYEVMNGLEYATIRTEAYNNAGIAGAATLYGDISNPSSITNYDWVNAMFRNARLRTYDASISGADDKTSFLFSGSYQEQEGQVIQSYFKRGTTRLKVNHKLSDKITIGANLGLSYVKTFGTIQNGNFVNGPLSAVFTMMPISPAINENTGLFNAYPLNNQAHNFQYNIVQGAYEEVRLGGTAQTVSNFNIAYEIMPGLTLNGFAGVDFSSNRDDNQRPSTIPAFAADNNQITVTFRRTLNYNTNATLNYSKKINEIHAISGVLGFEYKEEQRELVTAQQFGFANPRLRQLSQGTISRPAAGFFFDNKRQGFFGQVKYGYKDKYFADLTLRRDGSSRFGANNRYGTFYAGSAGWNIKSESFMDAVEFIDNLKIRASYGLVGNSEINDYDALTQYSTVSPAVAGGVGAQPGSFNGQSIFRPIRLGNDLLTWEEEGQFSTGVDFGLWGNRVFGSVEYYSNTTKALLFDVPLPSDAGFVNYKGNAGQVLNSGIEVELGGVALKVKDFKWNVSANFSTLHNEVTKLSNGGERLGGPGSPTFLIKGEPLTFNYVYDYAGVNPATGRALHYDINGNLTYNPVQAADGYAKSSPIPTYFGGVTNTFTFKGLSLEVFFQYQGGNEVFLGDLQNLALGGSSFNNQLRSQLARWQNPGDMTSVPRPFGNNGIINGFNQNAGAASTKWYSDGSYVRLKQVTLSYDLPTTMLSKIGMRKANLFVQGLNMLTWSKFAGIDPEVITAQNNVGGVAGGTFGGFPNGKQFMAGLTIGF